MKLSEQLRIVSVEKISIFTHLISTHYNIKSVKIHTLTDPDTLEMLMMVRFFMGVQNDVKELPNNPTPMQTRNHRIAIQQREHPQPNTKIEINIDKFKPDIFWEQAYKEFELELIPRLI